MKGFKKVLIVGAVIGIIGGAFGAYQWFMPKRDVQETAIDYTITSKALVAEYLKDAAQANLKYLANDGDSKILVVSGIIASINKNQKNEDVILLRDNNEGAGVICTFISDSTKTLSVKTGDIISVKGVIQSGASYDEDLEEYIDVNLNKAAINNVE
tara:strand:- start:2959 stop:3426 length:468 start_codon:yes stop_codon:yes gene_type:complete